jgi:hypothetical protein
MSGLRIINTQIAGESSAGAIGAGIPLKSSTPLAIGKPSLAELAYLLAALACGIAIAVFGSLMVYEELRLALMLLHIG